MKNTIKNNSDSFIYSSYILQDPKFPEFIKNHKIFKKITKISKIFPSIGLSNCSENCEFDNSQELISLATGLINDICWSMSNFISKDNNIRNLHKILSSQNSKMITFKNKKATIIVPCDISLGDSLVLKQGESFFKAYNKLISYFKTNHYFTLSDLDSYNNFKLFSSLNMGDNFKIVFSSTNVQGAWDLATISERGISSCQAWGTPQAYGLIGSIINKFVGVIYLTNGGEISAFNKTTNTSEIRGTKMLRRALVRYAINKKTKKPALLLDAIYPTSDNNIVTIFTNFLKNKTNMTVLPRTVSWESYYLPYDKLHDLELEVDCKTYMDTKIPYYNQLSKIPIIDINNAKNELANTDAVLQRNISDILYQKYQKYNTGDTDIEPVFMNFFKDSGANLYRDIYNKFRADPYNPNIILAFLKPLSYREGVIPPNNADINTINDYKKLIIKNNLLYISKLYKLLTTNEINNITGIETYGTVYSPSVLRSYIKELMNNYPKTFIKLGELLYYMLKKEYLKYFQTLC